MSARTFAVIGAGGWGTAMGGLLADKGFDVTMVGHDPVQVETMRRERRNDRFLEGYVFPERLRVTLSEAEALDGADVVLSAIPTKYVRSTWSRIGPRLTAGTPVVSLTKGIENGSLERPSQIIAAHAPSCPVAVLSGPSHAEEVARGLPTTVTIASSSLELAERLQDDLSTSRFRVYTNEDVFGVEFGGAVKNIIAIAAGILDGLGLGDNTKAALLTRGLAEIVELGCALGAQRETFYGMAGVGDLITTAFSPFGRNRAVGERIGRGETLDAILADSVKVAEGVATTRSIVTLAASAGVEMPITSAVHAVLFEDLPPADAIAMLMNRRGRGE